MTGPRVAVLMAVFNDARFVGAAIDSVLAQTYTDFELVIVIDGSTDGSREIVRSYDDPRIRVIDNHTNRGLAPSLNLGLAEIRSEYVARLDADDVAFPQRLARQVAWLNANPDVAVLGAQAVPIGEGGRRIRRVEWWDRAWHRPSTFAAMQWYRMFDTPFVHSGVMFRRSIVFDDLGGYDPQFLLAEDSELWMRVARRYRMANLEERLVAMRCHLGSLTTDSSKREHAGHVERITAIRYGIMRDVLGDDVPERWARLWTSVTETSTTSAIELRELVEALDSCSARFFELHPEAKDDPFIAEHYVSLLARATEKMIARDRGTALAIVPKMFARDAGTALRVLSRLLILFLFGNRAIAVWRSLRGMARRLS